MAKLPRPLPPAPSTVTFDLPAKIKVRDKISGLEGTITSRCQRINGCIQYYISPRLKDGETKIPEGIYLDFPDIEVIDANGIEIKPEAVVFKFETGDRVRNRVNGKSGIVTTCRIDANRCISYWFETGEQNRNGELLQYVAFEQELELVDKGLNAPDEAPLARRRTGCAHVKAPAKG